MYQVHMRQRILCSMWRRRRENEMAWTVYEEILLSVVNIFNSAVALVKFLKTVSLGLFSKGVKVSKCHYERGRICPKFPIFDFPRTWRGPHWGRHSRNRLWLHRFHPTIPDPVTDPGIPTWTRSKPKPGTWLRKKFCQMVVQ